MKSPSKNDENHEQLMKEGPLPVTDLCDARGKSCAPFSRTPLSCQNLLNCNMGQTNNKSVLYRPWTKRRVLRAISSTLKFQVTVNPES